MTVREFCIIYLEYLEPIAWSGLNTHIREIIDSNDTLTDHYLYAVCDNSYEAMKANTEVLSIMGLLMEYKKDMRNNKIDDFLEKY